MFTIARYTGGLLKAILLSLELRLMAHSRLSLWPCSGMLRLATLYLEFEFSANSNITTCRFSV